MSMGDKKRILLFIPTVYEIPQLMKKAFIKANYEIDCFSMDYGSLELYHKSFITGIKHKIKNRFAKVNWLSNFLELEYSIQSNYYDIVLAIGFFPFKKKLIETLRKTNPNLKCYYYLWDALEDLKIKYCIFNCFDKVYSFNRPDIQVLTRKFKDKEKFKYLPNFYVGNDMTTKKRNDILFVGSIHPDTLDRFSICNRLIEKFKEIGWKYIIRLKYTLSEEPIHLFHKTKHYFIPNTWISYQEKISKFLSQDKNAILTENPISYKELHELESSSKILLDLNHGKRQGYTLNVISAIGNHMKLISTNPNLKNEPFYHPNNILIIDETLKIDKEFLAKSIVPININCLEINNWIKLILEEDFYNKNLQSFNIK